MEVGRLRQTGPSEVADGRRRKPPEELRNYLGRVVRRKRVPHVSLITLGVADLGRATEFYETLGWERSSASVPGTVTFFHGSTAALALFGRDELAEDARVTFGSLDAFATVALAMNQHSEQAVDDVLAAAQRAGAEITKPAERTDWGGYSGYFRDPDGHLWEVAHNPGFQLRPDGGVILPDGP